MISTRFGKARVEIEVKGCIDCGTEHSSGWIEARIVTVTIGKRHVDLRLARCADCHNSGADLIGAMAGASSFYRST